MPAGAKKLVYAPYVEHVSPDVTACIFWLKNRKPSEWRDVQNIETDDRGRIIAGYQAIIDIAKVSRPINVFAEITLERQTNQNRFERRLAAIEEVVECWEVSGAVDYLARVVCADLGTYEALTSRLIDDSNLGVARIVSHVALRPVRRFSGYPESLLVAG